MEQPPAYVQPAEFVDPGELSAAAAGLPAGRSIFSIGIDSTGALSRLHLVESTLPREHSARLLDALRSSLSPGVLPERWAARLQVETAAAGPPEVAVGAYEECPPVLENPQRLAASLASLPRYQGRADVTMEAYVNTEGRVEDVRARNSSFGFAGERELLRIAQQLRFLPARVDREPVAIWVKLPVRFRREQ